MRSIVAEACKYLNEKFIVTNYLLRNNSKNYRKANAHKELKTA